MSKKLSLVQAQDLQKELADTIRGACNVYESDHSKHQRAQIYRDLFSRSIKSFLDETFFYLKQNLEESWGEIVASFIRYAHASSPYFYNVSEEFYQYLNANVESLNIHQAFVELAYFERCLYEVNLKIKATVNLINFTTHHDTDFLKQPLVFSPYLRRCCLHYDLELLKTGVISPQGDQGQFYLMYSGEAGVVIRLLSPISMALLSKFEVPQSVEEGLESI